MKVYYRDGTEAMSMSDDVLMASAIMFPIAMFFIVWVWCMYSQPYTVDAPIPNELYVKKRLIEMCDRLNLPNDRQRCLEVITPVIGEK